MFPEVSGCQPVKFQGKLHLLGFIYFIVNPRNVNVLVCNVFWMKPANGFEVSSGSRQFIWLNRNRQSQYRHFDSPFSSVFLALNKKIDFEANTEGSKVHADTITVRGDVLSIQRQQLSSIL